MKDEDVRRVCTGVLALAENIKHLQEIVDRLPKTADGKPFLLGETVYCPSGHAHEIRKSDPIGGQIYCVTKSAGRADVKATMEAEPITPHRSVFPGRPFYCRG